MIKEIKRRAANLETVHPLTGKPYGHYLGDPFGTDVIRIAAKAIKQPVTAYNIGMAGASAYYGDPWGTAYYTTQALRGYKGTVRRHRGYRKRWYGTVWKRKMYRYRYRRPRQGRGRRYRHYKRWTPPGYKGYHKYGKYIKWK